MKYILRRVKTRLNWGLMKFRYIPRHAYCWAVYGEKPVRNKVLHSHDTHWELIGWRERHQPLEPEQEYFVQRNDGPMWRLTMNGMALTQDPKTGYDFVPSSSI